MKKFLWLLKNKLICFLIVLVPIDILTVILTQTFVETNPTTLGVLCILWVIALAAFNIIFFTPVINPDELIEGTTDYFKNWWAQKPK
jgi:hypothetical protein